MRRGRVAVAGLSAVLAFSLAPAAVAAAPAADVVEAARALAAVQTKVAALEQQLPTDRTQVRAAGAALASAQEALAGATDTARAARERAGRTAKVAQRAIAEEQVAIRRAAEATLAMKRLAREMYINSGTSELAVFVGFAVDGPSALGAYARRDIALGNAGADTVINAERRARQSVEATVAADAARAEHQAATEAHRAARQVLADARAARTQANRALRDAERQLAADTEALAQARNRVAAAQQAYEDAVAAGGAGGPPISPGNQGPLVWSMLVAEGFSEEAAAGILGNLQQESNIDPTTIQNGGPGRGMAQWSQGGRWDNGPQSLLAFAQDRGLRPWNAVTQVRFMIYEMEYGIGGFDIDAYKSQTDVLAATIYFHDVFEASADSPAAVAAVRGGYAQQWYETLKGTGR